MDFTEEELNQMVDEIIETILRTVGEIRALALGRRIAPTTCNDRANLNDSTEAVHNSSSDDSDSNSSFNEPVASSPVPGPSRQQRKNKNSRTGKKKQARKETVTLPQKKKSTFITLKKKRYTYYHNNRIPRGNPDVIEKFVESLLTKD